MEALHECKWCTSVFDTANDRDSHSRSKCRQTYTLKLQDGSTKVIHRSKDKNFHRPISTCNCSCTRGDSLKTHYNRHFDKCVDNPKHEEKKEVAFCVTPDSSMTLDILRNANLCVIHHKNLVLLVCMSCNSALTQRTAKTIRKHVKSHGEVRRHSFLMGDEPNTKVMVQELQELATILPKFSFTSEDAEHLHPYRAVIQAELLDPVHGILIHNGFSCQKCVFFCGAKRTMDNHRVDCHAKYLISEVSSQCQVQVLFNMVGSKKYYGVQEKNLYGSDDTNVQIIQKLIREGFKNHIQKSSYESCPSIEEVTPWLRRSLWHETTKEFMPKGVPFLEVKAQIVLPSEGSGYLSYVAPLVSKYMDQLQSFLTKNQLDYTLRQKVKQDGYYQLLREGSVKTYNEVMASLIVSLLRVCSAEHNSPNFVIRQISNELRWALHELVNQLKNLTIDNVKDADIDVIHKVMFTVWTPEIPSILNPCKSSDCLFIRFLILDSMQGIGSDTKSTTYHFQRVKYQTQIFAKLQYWARGTILMELAQKLWRVHPREVMVDEIAGLSKYVIDHVFGTPWNTIAQYMKLASTVATKEPSKPRIFKCDDFSTSCAMDGGNIDVPTMQRTPKVRMLSPTLCQIYIKHYPPNARSKSNANHGEKPPR